MKILSLPSGIVSAFRSILIQTEFHQLGLIKSTLSVSQNINSGRFFNKANLETYRNLFLKRRIHTCIQTNKCKQKITSIERWEVIGRAYRITDGERHRGGGGEMRSFEDYMETVSVSDMSTNSPDG